MSWKYYLLIITLFLFVIACVPLIFKSNRAIAREWMSGYAGLLAIGAAVIASVPVFQQMDEARLATKNIRIQLIASAQRSLDEERARTDDVEKIAEDAASFHLLPSSDTVEKINIWKIKAANIYQEMTLKTDKPPFLYNARSKVAESVSVFLKEISAFENAGRSDKLKPNIESAAKQLVSVCQNYDKSSHNQIEQMHLKIVENEKELLDY